MPATLSRVAGILGSADVLRTTPGARCLSMSVPVAAIEPRDTADFPAGSLDALYLWHSCTTGRQPYQWVAPTRAGGVFHCAGCTARGRCVVCAEERRRPLSDGTIPVLCRVHAGLQPDEPDLAIAVDLAWPSWKPFPLTPLPQSVCISDTPSIAPASSSSAATPSSDVLTPPPAQLALFA